jgi:3-isopropylmalate/(R)-2-methylmalate dehydratase small subunit
VVEELGRAAESGTLELQVDLEAGTVVTPGGHTYPFETPAPERRMLLEGLDEIGLTLKRRDEILAFQTRDRAVRPWIWAV